MTKSGDSTSFPLLAIDKVSVVVVKALTDFITDDRLFIPKSITVILMRILICSHS